MKKLAFALLCLVLPFGRSLMADQMIENNTDHDITYTLSWTDDWSYDHWDYDHGWTDTGQDSGSDTITLGAGQSVYIVSETSYDYRAPNDDHPVGQYGTIHWSASVN